MGATRKRIPRDPEDDYTRDAAVQRPAIVAEQWVDAHDLHGRNRP